jgi:hypothetical protein
MHSTRFRRRYSSRINATSDARVLGVAESTVLKYMIQRRGPPSQSWRTLLRNHVDAIAAVDLCVVPTLTFERLFAFLVLGHGRRQLLWFAVTRNPSAEWLAQQMAEAFPWTRRQPIWCTTMIVPTGRPFSAEFERWGFVTDPCSRDDGDGYPDSDPEFGL